MDRTGVLEVRWSCFYVGGSVIHEIQIKLTSRLKYSRNTNNTHTDTSTVFVTYLLIVTDSWRHYNITIYQTKPHCRFGRKILATAMLMECDFYQRLQTKKFHKKIFVCLSVHLHASARISKAKIGVKHCDTHTLPLYVCSAPICLKIFNLVCLSMRLPEGTFLWQALWPLAVHTGSQNVGQVPKYFYIWFDNVVIRTFMLYSRTEKYQR